MVFATSLDFATGRVAQGAPTAIWWTQLATAVVFGLGMATVLTLVVTPAALAARIWFWRGVGALAAAGGLGAAARERALRRQARRTRPEEILWETDEPLVAWPRGYARAAE
jgi:multidrug efflux pump